MIRPRIKVEMKNSDIMDHLLKVAPQLKRAFITVGFHEDAADYPDGQGVVEVALWNEFGTENMPSRSFIRSSFDENTDKINKWREEAIVNIIMNQQDVTKEMESLGFKLANLVRTKIASNVPPPNAPSTIAAKKNHVPNNSGRTLIDSGHMISQVAYKVHV